AGEHRDSQAEVVERNDLGEVDTEELRSWYVDPLLLAEQDRGVVPDLLHRDGETEGGDGDVDAPEPDRHDRHQSTDGNRDRAGDEQCERPGDSVGEHVPGGGRADRSEG